MQIELAISLRKTLTLILDYDPTNLKKTSFYGIFRQRPSGRWVMVAGATWRKRATELFLDYARLW